MIRIFFDAAATLWPWNLEGKSNNEFTSNLSDDVLLEILVRVPDSGSAIRCGAVCKRWNNLTAKNPQFVQTFIHHRRRCGGAAASAADRQHISFLLQKSTLRNRYKIFLLWSKIPDHALVEKCPLNFLDFVPGGAGVIRASFNDLLLVSTSWTTDYFIFNMITKQWVRLPPGPRAGSSSPSHGLICKKLSPTNIIYRVVLFYYKSHNQIPVDVFSSETLEWTTSTIDYRLDPIGPYSVGTDDSAVARGGILYLNHPYGRGCVIAFDPFGKGSEKRMRSRFVALPEEITSNRMMISLNYPVELCLGVCRGRLRVCQMSFDGLNNHRLSLEAWELKEDERGSWCLVHRAEFCIGDFVRNLRVAKFHQNDPDVVFLNDKRSVYRCDFPEKKLVKVADLPDSNGTDTRGKLTLISIVRPHWPTPVPALQLPN